MRPLTPVHGPHIDRYVEIRESKRTPARHALKAIHPNVASQFSLLEAVIAEGRLHTASPCPTCSGASDHLLSCYYSPTLALRRLTRDIKAAQGPRRLQRCPMCGITRPGTFDHYLPSSLFPEFSVHALNLVPCCSTCNSIKDDDWLSGTGARQYIHAFSDAIPAERFLFVDLVDSADGTVAGALYSLKRPAGVQHQAWKVIELHFERLRLLERYSELSGDEIADFLALCRSCSEAGATSAPKFLNLHATDLESIFGGNDWRATLARALANHPTLDALVASTRPTAP